MMELKITCYLFHIKRNLFIFTVHVTMLRDA